MTKEMAKIERQVSHRHGRPRGWGVILQQSGTDMIKGGVFRSILWFLIPLLIGNLFQQLYNTVDSYVVGNFTDIDALAAVGVSMPIINMLVEFFMELSAGAGVIVSQYLRGKQEEEMNRTIHSSVAPTAPLSIVFAGTGVVLTKPLLRAIGVSEEVLPHSSLYLLTHFGGVVSPPLYSMGADILRAVGDSRHPLIYLAVVSLVNITLDSLFVCGFHMGAAGTVITTIITQVVGSAMVLYKLMHTQGDYRIELCKVRFHRKMVHRIVPLGFPVVLQQSITSFSNVVMQSYINFFSTAAMAGYSATLRIDGSLQLPLQSFNIAITTFVGQNIGAHKYKRVKEGVWTAWAMCSLVILVGSVCIYFFTSFLTNIFAGNVQVVVNGSGMLRIFSTAYIILPMIQILDGALGGAGPSRIPMFFMLDCLMILRQTYPMIAVPMTHNMFVVLTGWPVTWVTCVIGTLIYYVKVDWLPEEAEE